MSIQTCEVLEIDSCGKRAAVESDTPETAKKSKVDLEDLKETKRFDPTFGAGTLKTSEDKEGDEDAEADEATGTEEESEVEDDDDSNEDATSNVLEELISMFKEQNGRDPTEEEIKMWVQTLKEHVNESLGNAKLTSDGDLPQAGDAGTKISR